jgi:hypothetical protein
MDIFNTNVLVKFDLLINYQIDDEENKDAECEATNQTETHQKHKLLEENNRKFIEGNNSLN